MTLGEGDRSDRGHPQGSGKGWRPWKPQCTVAVTGVSERTKKTSLQEAFGEFGRIIRIEVPAQKTVAFVEYEEKRDASDAIADMNGKTIEGRRIGVRLVEDLPPKVDRNAPSREDANVQHAPATGRADAPWMRRGGGGGGASSSRLGSPSPRGGGGGGSSRSARGHEDERRRSRSRSARRRAVSQPRPHRSRSREVTRRHSRSRSHQAARRLPRERSRSPQARSRKDDGSDGGGRRRAARSSPSCDATRVRPARERRSPNHKASRKSPSRATQHAEKKTPKTSRSPSRQAARRDSSRSRGRKRVAKERSISCSKGRGSHSCEAPRNSRRPLSASQKAHDSSCKAARNGKKVTNGVPTPDSDVRSSPSMTGKASRKEMGDSEAQAGKKNAKARSLSRGSSGS